MRNFIRILGLGVLLTVSAGALAAGSAAGQVAVDGAYVRAVPPGQPNSAAFMTLRNTGDADHAVVAAASRVAKVVELHTHTMVNGMMQMRRIPRIDVAAKSSTELKPGGLHIMLINLTRPLRVGDTVALTLKFADGSEKQIKAPVRTIADSMSMGKGMGGAMHR
ncbi:MAG: copper chaperone PCu(A)C [Gammaproteobacteria bacterium]